MFPALPPGGIDAGPVRRPEPAEGPGPSVGVQPVRMDPQGARQPAPAVAGSEASNTRVRPEALATQDRQARGADARQPPAPVGPQAATVSPRLQWLIQGLQALLGATAASGAAASAAASAGATGAADSLPWPAAGQPVADTPLQALARLHAALGQSPWFALNPRTTAELGAGMRQFAAWQAAPGAGAADTSAPAEAAEPAIGTTGSPADAATATATAAAAAATLWDAAAATATPRQTVEALQLLLHGRLQWEGELTPGVQAQLRRETVWEEDPDHPGQLQSGSLLRLDLALPAIGPLVVLARLVGGRCAVQLLPAAAAVPALDAALAELQTALAPLTETPVALSLQAPP